MTPEREKVLREWVLVDEIWADLDSSVWPCGRCGMR